MMIYDKTARCLYMQQCVRFLLETQHPKFKRLLEKIQKRYDTKGNPLLDNRKEGQIYIVTSERASVERTRERLERETDKEREMEHTLLILDFYPDSRMTPKYIQQKLEMGNKGIKIHRVKTLEYDERDAIAQLESAYEERVDLKAHSKPWITVAMQLRDVFIQSQPDAVSEEVGIDADSYLVRS